MKGRRARGKVRSTGRKLTKRDRQQSFAARSYIALGLMTIAGLVLGGRAVQLQLVDQDFLNNQADARQLRNI